MLCRVQPVLGQGNTAMDEAGYLWLPPCMWGSPEEGMNAPPVLKLDTNLTSIKRVCIVCNFMKWLLLLTLYCFDIIFMHAKVSSVVGHTGVMAIWQARGAYVE